MPVQLTSSLNISMLCQPSYLQQGGILVNMVGSHSGASGLMNNISLSLIGNPPSGTTTSSLFVSLNGQTRGVVSSVLNLSMNAANSIFTNTVAMSMFSSADTVFGNCFVLEENYAVEIDMEGTTSCIGAESQAMDQVSMFMLNDGGSALQSSLNLVLRFNPTNIVNMTMRCQGTQVTNLTDLDTEDDDEILIDDDSDFLAVYDPLIVTLLASAVSTNVVNMSMPVSHAIQTNVVTMNSRGF